MKTKYIEVKVSDRLPSEEGKYIIIDAMGNITKGVFSQDEFNSWQPVEYWLEKVPDYEDEAITLLRLAKIQCIIADNLEFKSEIDNFLQKVNNKK